jgi:hypothetical protein
VMAQVVESCRLTRLLSASHGLVAAVRHSYRAGKMIDLDFVSSR